MKSMFETRIRYIFFLFLQIQVSILLLRPPSFRPFLPSTRFYTICILISQRSLRQSGRDRQVYWQMEVSRTNSWQVCSTQIIYMKNSWQETFRCTIELAEQFASRGFWGNEDAQLIVHWILDLQQIGFDLTDLYGNVSPVRFCLPVMDGIPYNANFNKSE